MEKLTISRLGQEKTIEYINKKRKTSQHPEGTPDSFKKIGFLTNEHGEKWFDLTFRGEVPVQVGKSYDFEIKSREYNGKTYYDAELPKENRGGGINKDDLEAKFLMVNRKLDAIFIEIRKLATEAHDAKVKTAFDGPELPPADVYDDPLEGINPFGDN